MIAPRPPRNAWPLHRAGLLALLLAAGCAADRPEIARKGHVPVIRDYAAPADTAPDRWAPYIAEAAARHDIPEAWIREVIERESSFRPRAVSRAGAMGLMQVMPGTWADLRLRYGLGRDPFHPRDNILAGTAYLREMYDQFGAPGFLAAYHAGPGAFTRYLAGRGRLPAQTRRYVAAIVPRIEGTRPARSEPPETRVAAAPTEIAPGLRRAGPSAPAMLDGRLPAPPASPARQESVRAAEVAQPPPPRHAPEPGRFQLVSAAHAAPMPPAPSRPVAGTWSIQVGAFRTVGPARTAVEQARLAVPDLLATAQAATPDVETPNGRFVRARLVGLSAETALTACRIVERRGQRCFVVAPAAQG